MTLHWSTWALLSALFAALTALLAKVGVRDIDPDIATWIRTAVVLLSLGALILAQGKWSNAGPFSSRTITFLVLSGLATGASWLCYFRALQGGPLSLVAPIDKLSVVIVALLAFGLLGERPHPREWIGLALVSGGVTLIAWR